MHEVGYLSKRANISTRALLGIVCIYGPSTISDDVRLDHGVVVGYPMRNNLLNLKNLSHEEIDRASKGAFIGKGCVIRRYTVIYETAILGSNVETGHSVLIREGVKVGNGSKIGTHSILDGDVIIGSNVNIQSNVYLPKKSRVGDDVFIGPGVCVTNDKYPPSKRLLGVEIKSGAIIGAFSVLISGIKVGRGAIIAAGSVVTKDVPDEALVMGVPARVVGNKEEYEVKKSKYERY